MWRCSKPVLKTNKKLVKVKVYTAYKILQNTFKWIQVHETTYKSRKFSEHPKDTLKNLNLITEYESD